MTGLAEPLTNPRAERVRRVAQLARRAGRERAAAFVAEGPQAVREAVAAHAASGDVVLDLYATEPASTRWAAELDAARSVAITTRLVSDEVMAAMTDTVSPQGLLAVCRLLDRPLNQVLDTAAAASPALVTVLSHVRDPGNAGTVLRASDAAGASAVLLTEASVDVHNPKCVRSTAGSLFHLPVSQGAGLVDVVSALHERGLVVLAADGAGDVDLDDLQDVAESDDAALLRRPTAWVFGNEAWGLSPEQRDLADAVVRVPLHGAAESLNLAMAATVCLYASSRAQRRRPGNIGQTR